MPLYAARKLAFRISYAEALAAWVMPTAHRKGADGAGAALLRL